MSFTPRHRRRMKKNLRGEDDRKVEEVLSTARQLIKKKGGKEAAAMFDIANNPQLAKDVSGLLKQGVAEKVKPAEALAYVMAQSLSRARYLAEKKMDKRHNGKKLPHWGKVRVRILLLTHLILLLND